MAGKYKLFTFICESFQWASVLKLEITVFCKETGFHFDKFLISHVSLLDDDVCTYNYSTDKTFKKVL